LAPDAGAPDISLRGLTKRFGDVVALFVIVVSAIPVYIATRLAGSSGITAERPKRSTVAANLSQG
jgi:hypothetical protein